MSIMAVNDTQFDIIRNLAFNIDASSPNISQAINQVYKSTGDIVSVYEEKSSLLKFGENADVDTSEETLMEFLGSETAEVLQTSNTIDSLVCDDNSFTETVTIQGCTIDGSGNFTAVSQDITATGQVAATLSTPLARVYRGFNAGSNNMLASSKIYIYRSSDAGGLTAGVPNTASSVNMIINSEEQQSLKAAYTTASDEYLFICDLFGTINEKTNTSAIIRLKTQEQNGVFRTRLKLGLNSNGGALAIRLEPFFIVPPNTDMILTAEADANGKDIAGAFQCFRALKLDVQPNLT